MPEQLENSECYAGPAWSPSGDRLAFTYNGVGQGHNLYVYDVNSKKTQQLTHTGLGVTSMSPCWSPDGKRIAFDSGTDQQSDIYVMNADGSQLVRVTEAVKNVLNAHPSWSPDGRYLAYASDQLGCNEVFVLDLKTRDTTSPTLRALYNSAPDFLRNTAPWDGKGKGPGWLMQRAPGYINNAPAWSPNGKWIAHTHSPSRVALGYVQLVKPDGSEWKCLTERGNNCFYPAWSPDASRIAFISDRTGLPNIWVMNVDGSNERQITSDGGVWPCWHPGGKQISYISSKKDIPRIYTVSV